MTWFNDGYVRALLFSAAFAILATPLPAAAQNDPPSPPAAAIQPPEKPELLFDLEHVYGRYYFGDGLGVNCSLTITEEQRFAFSWHGCLGEYDRNAGKWEVDGDVLVLKPEQENVHRGFQGVNVRYIPVRVGEIEFLVDEYEMPGFCASLKAEDGPSLFQRHGNDYVKSDREEIVIQGIEPVIPERFRHFYEKGAIEAEIARFDEDGNAVLNKGARDRLGPGMRLEFNGFEGSIELVVVSTTESEAAAKPQYYWNSGPRAAKVGDEFTTGGYFHRPRGTGFERFDQAPPIDAQCEDPDDDR